MLVLGFAPGTLVIAVAAVPIVLVAGLLAVAAPIVVFPWSKRLSMRNVPFLTWAGVRGDGVASLASLNWQGQGILRTPSPLRQERLRKAKRVPNYR